MSNETILTQGMIQDRIKELRAYIDECWAELGKTTLDYGYQNAMDNSQEKIKVLCTLLECFPDVDWSRKDW